MADDLVLNIFGQRFTGWEGITITRTLDSCADGFGLTAPFDPARADLRAALRPFGYQLVVLTVGLADLVLTGRIEKVSPSISEGDRTVTVEGRSLTGALIDGAIDGVGYQFDGLTLKQIADKVASPFGVPVKSGLDVGSPMTEARAEPGDTVFEFLQRLSTANGRLLTCDTDGSLIITKADPNQAPVASIVEGQPPFMAATGSFDGTARWSSYKVLAQENGTPGLQGQAIDSGVAAYRPRIDVGHEGEGRGVNQAAAWNRALALAGSVSVTVTLSGWRDGNGAIWKPGVIVTLKAPSIWITRDTRFMVSAATLSLDGSGQRTDLTLILPSTYTGEMPGSYPWD